MRDFSDRTGPPPTAEEFRAALADVLPADMPITAALHEGLVQAGEQRTGDRDRDLAAILSVIVSAIGKLERRIIDGQ